jgi:hypothetical protein
MPKPSKRDQLVEATKELLWEVGTRLTTTGVTQMPMIYPFLASGT